MRRQIGILLFSHLLFGCEETQLKGKETYYLEIGNYACDSVVFMGDAKSNYYLLGCAEKAQLEGRYMEYFGSGDTVLGFCSYEYGFRKSLGFSTDKDFYLELMSFSNGALNYPEIKQYEGDSLLTSSKFFDISTTEDAVHLEPVGYSQDSILVHWKDSLLLGTSGRHFSLSKDVLENLVQQSPLEIRLISFKENNRDFVARLHQLNYQRIKYAEELWRVPDSIGSVIVKLKKLGPVAKGLINSKANR